MGQAFEKGYYKTMIVALCGEWISLDIRLTTHRGELSCGPIGPREGHGENADQGLALNVER